MRPITIFGGLAVIVSLVGCDIGHHGSGLHIGLGRTAGTPFEWRGAIDTGQQLEIQGVHGSIHVRAASGPEIEITADRRGRRSDPDEVRIDVIEHPEGVTVCAVYPGEGNRCLPGEASRLETRGNDVTVDFEVRVPAGIGLVARTVNGRVDVVSIEGNVEARSVNGSIEVSSAGRVYAETVNGSIDAQLSAAAWTGETALQTVNGSVTVAVPERLDAAIRAKTSNGSIRCDLPLQVEHTSRRRLEGTLGQGGGALVLETVNGSVIVSAVTL